MDYEAEEEPPRPEFTAKAYCEARNPVTGLKEPSFPDWVRKQRIIAGGAVLLLMVRAAVLLLVLVIRLGSCGL